MLDQVSYCVWDPSAVAPLQGLIPSILPKPFRGQKEQPAFPSEMLFVPAPRAAETEGVLGSRSPHSPW